ncbi:MAG TPA: acylphosphatase [Patescibacteria group bacterium]|nr:acylphosphatase [Patescibacteria group bacterium]
MIKHLTITVYGRVQMVGYRFGVRRQAVALGLCGFARNEANGTVRVEAEGTEKKLAQLLVWCHRGSLLARVDRIEYAYTAERKNFDDFRIF